MAKATDNTQVQVIEIEVDGIKYTQTRPGYYYKKTESGQKRIPKSEWEQAFDAYTAQVDEADEVEEPTEEDEMEAKEATLDAEMEKLGYYRIDSEWNDIRYSNDAHQVLAWNSVEEGLNWLEEQWDTENEVEERKEIEEQKDRETEKNFNGKKTKKARRPKDVAFEADTLIGRITLTSKQVDFIKHLPDTNFWENGLDSAPWCDVLADEIGGQFAGKPMTVGAMISTLREKHLVEVGRDTSRKGNPKYMTLTETGKAVARKLGLN